MLVIFPTTIRRRILRHLYLRQVCDASLFKGVAAPYWVASRACMAYSRLCDTVCILSEEAEGQMPRA